MFRATELSGFGAGGKPPFIPDSDFWNGSQLSSFTIGVGTINRNTTNDDQRRWVYSDAFGGDYIVDMVIDNWIGSAEQVMVGWFRSSDLASFDDDENYARPMRVANSQGVIAKDSTTDLLLNENTTNQSNDLAGSNGTKLTFKRAGSTITLLVNDSLHDTSALTNTDDIRLMYGAYASGADGGGLNSIQIISDTGT